ncbi:NADH-quinone oxidoreductase subunit E [Halovulum sp. GXIMD14793]
MLRRLYSEQPESFEFTPGNLVWAKAQIAKYPEGRQASAVIPLLWRAQEQEGWVTKPAIEYVADMLGMARIRVMEVASFYFMFQLQPVGSVANIQICGTTSCMICGAEDLVGVCKDKIAPAPHQVSADGKFSWEEVECLGACANAPMAQIGKDYYEDLTAEKLADIIDQLSHGEVPLPGPQNGRFSSEAAGGRTTLVDGVVAEQANASVDLAQKMGDTVARITDGEISAPMRIAGSSKKAEGTPKAKPVKAEPKVVSNEDKEETVSRAQPAPDAQKVIPSAPKANETAATSPAVRPEGLSEARDGTPDDLKKIRGVGPKLEKLLHSLGFFHFDQVANWTKAEITWVDDNLEGFKGRVTRDEWVSQAREFAKK